MATSTTSTPYYAMYAGRVLPNRSNGIYGHGKERALAIADVLDGTGVP